ncbi:MAG TPA: hypothetical protein VJV78_01240 [Polyangiales bacterium]|nr:hypothetical protein [Polyangiales bacterium]
MNAAATRVTLALILLGALAACGEPVTVSVGQLGDAIDLTRCMGENLVCDLEQASKAPVAIQLDVEPIPDCKPAEEPAWHVAWTLPVDRLPCEDAECESVQFEFAADGSVWLAATTVGTGRARLLLGHYTANGTLVAKAVETWPVRQGPDRPIDLSLASNSQGQALVALSWQRDSAARTGWIAKYDRAALQVGSRVSLEGIESDDTLHLAIAPSDQVLLLAGNDSAVREGHLARLDASLRLQWLQSSALPAALDVLVDEHGEALVVTNLGRAATLLQFGFHWYDSHGNLGSSLTLPIDNEYVQAGRDDSVLTTQIKVRPGGPSPLALVFREVARDGRILWAAQIAAGPGFPWFSDGVSIEISGQQLDPEGAIYRFVRQTSHADATIKRSALFRIDPATSVCSFALVDARQPESSTARRAGFDAGVGDAPDDQLIVTSFFINARGDFYVDAHSAQGGRRMLAKLER